LYILVVMIEAPLIAGLFLPLTTTTYNAYILPLLTKEEIEIEAGGYTYNKSLPGILQRFFTQRYMAMAAAGETSELAQIELMRYPERDRERLYLAPGFQFGANVTVNDCKFIKQQITEFLHLLGILTEEVVTPGVKPLHLECVYERSDNRLKLSFPETDRLALAVGFMSMYALPITIILPFVSYYEHVRELGNDTASELYRMPFIVWCCMHAIPYIMWTLKYLTCMHIEVEPREESAQGGVTHSGTFRAWRTFQLFPRCPVPFLYFDKLCPVFVFRRPLTEIVDVHLHVHAEDGVELGSRVAVRFRSPWYRSRLFVFPGLCYHEMHWLLQEVKSIVDPPLSSNEMFTIV
jgi:hypothetical protein